MNNRESVSMTWIQNAKRWSVIGFYSGFFGNILFWLSPLAPSLDFDWLRVVLFTSVIFGVLFATIGFYCARLVERESRDRRLGKIADAE